MSNPHSLNQPASGKVWLVGAGPGDPELLTLKALRAIESADLILFDQLVSNDIRALFPPATPAFYVGKVKGNHSIAQTDLNSLLVKKARLGLNIVRLKGGDPFVFGRGGEELACLAKSQIDVEVVPGITAASGCSAASRIPLTHRGVSQGCTFVTAHAESELKVDWRSLAGLRHTLVFYMGLTKAQTIQHELIANGCDSRTPVAVIENGSRDNQRQVVGSLGELTQLISDNAMASPALIIVGDVVDLSRELNVERLQSIINEKYMTKCA